MAKHRVTVWMGTSAAVLAAASLAACSAPGAPQVETASVAPEAPGATAGGTVNPPAAASPVETAAAAEASASPAAAAVQDAPAAKAASPAAAPPAAPAPAAPAAAPTAAPASNNGEFVDGPGKAVVQKACVSCHVAGQVTSQRRSKDQWADTVEKMISYGAPVSDAEFDTIVAYLARHYGG